MRLTAVIPLVALGLTALLFHAVRLDLLSGETSAAVLNIRQADITSTLGESKASFSAVRVKLSIEINDAHEVRGALITPINTYQFAADRIVRPSGAPHILLQGDGFISYLGRMLRSEHIVMDPLGILRGNNVTIEDGDYYATAEHFVLDNDILELTGEVQLIQP